MAASSEQPPVPSMAAGHSNDLTEPARKRTLALSIKEGGVWSFMAGLGEMYFSPFAVFMNAGNRALALLGTMPALVGAASQMFGAYLTDRWRNRRGLLVWFSVGQALLFLPLFLVPLGFPAYAVPAILVIAALEMIAGQAIAPAWISLMGDVVPAHQRGEYFGHRGRVVMAMVFVATTTAGLALSFFEHHHRVAWGFGLIFSLACLARLVSARLLSLHADPPYQPTASDFFSFWDFIRRMPYSNFARFSLYVALMMGAINVASPFFTVYMLRDLHWTYAQYTANNVVFLATQFFLLKWWGRMGDRYGNRVVLVATSFIIPIMPVLWTLCDNFFYLLGVQIFAGAGWSGFTIAMQNFTFDAVTPQKRARVSAYMALLNGLFVFAGGTFIGAWLANHLPAAYTVGGIQLRFVSSLPVVFIISGVLRGLTALLLIPRFKEVRSTDRIHPVVLLLRLAGGTALAGFLEQAASRLAYRRRRYQGGPPRPRQP